MASEADTVWNSVTKQLGAVVEPTAQALKARHPQFTAKQLFKQLTKVKNTCTRCKQTFTDAQNTPQSCSYHPGILFSGALHNGHRIFYTCCNRRAHHISIGRDSNGCASAYHYGGSSAWVKSPQAGLLSVVGPSAAANSLVDVGYQNVRELHEWHPDHRPGCSIAPSRLVM